MGKLDITKSYADGTGLIKDDIDNIIDDIETFVNIEKLSASNIQSQTLEKEKFDSSIYDNSTVGATSSVLEVKDAGITDQQIALSDRHAPIGTICLFHTFGGLTSVPRGWMICDGDVINETNYNATHGSGTYDTDGISGSTLLSKYLPDFTDSFARGAASTTEDGSSTIATQGNTGNTASGAEHNHKWIEYNGASSNTQLRTIDGNWGNVSGNQTGSYNALWGTTAGGSAIAEDAYSDNQLGDLDITPLSMRFQYIMKVI